MEGEQDDLFDKYPRRAGSHRNSLATSREAADGIEGSGRAANLRTRAAEWYKAGNKGTADDCAKALRQDLLAIRPRVTELTKQGLLVQTGERRRSLGGRFASVMKWSRP